MSFAHPAFPQIFFYFFYFSVDCCVSFILLRTKRYNLKLRHSTTKPRRTRNIFASNSLKVSLSFSLSLSLSFSLSLSLSFSLLFSFYFSISFSLSLSWFSLFFCHHPPGDWGAKIRKLKKLADEANRTSDANLKSLVKKTMAAKKHFEKVKASRIQKARRILGKRGSVKAAVKCWVLNKKQLCIINMTSQQKDEILPFSVSSWANKQNVFFIM